MPFYADLPARRTRQIAVDAVVALTVVVAVVVALAVRDAVLSLRAPGERLIEAGGDLQGTFDGAADAAGRIPLVGEGLAERLGSGGGAGETLVAAGEAQIAAVETLAGLLAAVIVGVPLLVALVTWLPWRLLYARRSTAARRTATAGQTDLLALRALTRMPPTRLAEACGHLPDDPASGWRKGDPEVIRVLAAEEMRSHGLRL